MPGLEKAKKNLIIKIDDLFGFNLSNRQDGVSYDFGQYRLNKLYKPLVKYFIDQYLDHLKDYSPQDVEKILGLFTDFFALYYSNGDFGYFKNKFSSYEYRIPYSGKDTEFWRATKDCYYVKTSDVVNDMAVNLGGLLEDREVQLKMFKKTEPRILESGEERFDFDIIIEDILDEETEEFGGYKITFVNYEEAKGTKRQKENLISEILSEKGIDYGNPAVKKSIDEFLKKRGRDYFIHKRLKAFLTEELERYFFQMLKTDLQSKVDILQIQGKIEEIRLKYADDPEVIEFKIGQLMKEAQTETKFSVYEVAYLWILNFINILADLEEFKAKLWNKKRKVLKKYNVISLKSLVGHPYFDNILAAVEGTLKNDQSYLGEVKGIIGDKYRDSLQGKYVTGINFDFNSKKITLNFTKFKKNLELKEMPSGFVLNDYMIYENEQGEFLFENTRGNVYVPEKESVEVVDLVENIYLDSKYFDFNELKIDFKESRGLLIKSENYQALNYLDNIVKGEVDLIRIDPPFNTNNDQFYYKDDYLDSSWLSLMADRINLSSRLGSITSSTYIHLDENGEHFMRIINDDNLGFKRTLFWNSGGVGFKGGDNWIRSGDIINYFSNKPDGNPIWNPSNNNERNSNFINSLSVQDSWFNNKENLGSFWRVKGTTQKTEDYVSRYIFRSSNEDSYVMDYFMGTGTIPAICHKTGRKYLGIDMGEHFDLIAIKRMKKVLIGDLSGISNDIDENGNKREGGGVFTYLYLNQYEDRFNAGGYLDQIEGDMTEFSNIDVATITDIKQILFPLSELKETIYGLDD